MKKLLLMDGNNVMFRAYFATAAMGNLMRNKDGFPTNMIYGFINIYNKVINDGYTHVAVAFDAGSKTRRHKMYKDYKAGRAETPSELIEQIPYIHEFLEAVNVKYFLNYDYEADDIISSLHKSFKDEFDEVDVLSNDNDLFQLIGPNSFQIYTKLKETIKYSTDTLFNEKGITPIQIPDYKGLIGDNSDNLKGVEGIGPKTAAKLLSEYNTLEGIYENIDSIKGKNQERLIKDKETAFFTKDMATLDPSFDFNLPLEAFEVKEPNYDALKKFYIKLDFYSFLKKLQKPTIKEQPKSAFEQTSLFPIETKDDVKDDFKEIKNVDEIKEVNALVDEIKQDSIPFEYKVIDNSFDIEGIILKDEINYLVLDLLHENYHTSEKIGFGLSNSKGNYFISFDTALLSFDFQLFLGDESIKKAVYDYKKMYVALLSENVTLTGVVFDTLLASYLINPDLSKDDLSLIAYNFGYYDIEADELIYGKKDKEVLPELNIYSSHIAKKAFVLNYIYEKELKEIEVRHQTFLLNEVEIPFSKVLGDMEYLGLRVDTETLDKYEDELLVEMNNVEGKIYDYAGHEFNILSPKQVGTVLFEEMGLKSSKKTKTGYSTDSSVLEELRFESPIIDQILRFRTLSKLESTYVNGVRQAIKEKNDNHIHTIYKQALTDTGRLSSTEPNLQNLPIRNKESSEFRKVFIPENNCYLMSSDYSQIELRVLAHMSEDENLIKAFKNGEDIHEATAKAILKKETVTKEERSSAKAINFGIVYGISAWGLSNDIGITPKQAQEFINMYHESFPRILPFTQSLIENAETTGYVWTIFNRRRYIRDIHSTNYYQREFSKRTAMNAPIQGTAADILKLAMVKLDKALKKNMLHGRLVLTIHDEVVLNVPKEEIEKTKKITEEVLTTVMDFRVPLLVETNYGNTLYEAK